MNKHLIRYSRHLICLFLVLITLVAYWGAWSNGFTNFDDNKYVTDNQWVKAGLTSAGIQWAFTATHAANWHPLTWISHMADVSLYQLRPAGHHVTSLILHVLNVLLLFLVLLRLVGRNPIAASPPHPLSPSSVWKCTFVAALFAVHPLHVESVAWIAERKDVLSTFFFLLTTLAYARYAARPGITRYLPVVGLYAFGLMAKPMLVTLPFVLLLLDYWPLGRFNVRWEGEAPAEPTSRRSTRFGSEFEQEPPACPEHRSLAPSGRLHRARPDGHKAPGYGHAQRESKDGTTARRKPRPPDSRKLDADTRSSTSKSKSKSKGLLLEKVPLLLLALGSCLATYTAQGQAVTSLNRFPVGVRAENALVSYVSYIGKMLWPAGLAVFYPYHVTDTLVWQALGSLALLMFATALVIRYAARLPYLAVGWFWYLITLVPVIGLVQVGGQRMADRYTYIPLIGLFVTIAWGVPELLKVGKGERGKGRAEELIDGMLSKPSIHPFSLSSILALAVLIVLSALASRQVGYWRNSETLFAHTLRVTAANPIAHNNLGLALVEAGKVDEAVEQYRRALDIDPRYPHAHNNLALALAYQEDYRGAIEEYRKAIEYLSGYPEIHNNLGYALAATGDYAGAAKEYDEALRLNPRYADALNNRGQAFVAQNRIDAAVQDYEEAIRLEPNRGEFHGNLALAFCFKGRYADAWREVHTAEGLGYALSPEFRKALARVMPEPQ